MSSCSMASPALVTRRAVVTAMIVGGIVTATASAVHGWSATTVTEIAIMAKVTGAAEAAAASVGEGVNGARAVTAAARAVARATGADEPGAVEVTGDGRLGGPVRRRLARHSARGVRHGGGRNKGVRCTARMRSSGEDTTCER